MSYRPEYSFDFEKIESTLGVALQSASTELDDALKALQAAPDDVAALADFQVKVNTWSAVWNLVSTANRVQRDTLNNILQKI